MRREEKMKKGSFLCDIKRGTVLLLITVMVVGLTGCGKKEEETPAISVEPEMTIDTTSNNAVETPIIEIENPVAADVAEMDDAGDPQAEENTDGESSGAKVEITVLKNEYETSGITLGIDVAKWQGTIDWQQVAASGIEFALIRVGYRAESTGVIYEDPCAKYNLQQAQAAGIKLGAYFYSTAITAEEAAEEAAWVTSFIAQYPITYPVAYNCENFKTTTSRQYSLTKEERSSIAMAFLDYVQAKGYTPMFYASKNELTDNTDWETDQLAAKYKIWVSQYPEVPYPQTASSSYTGSHAMWQYTSNGTIAGVPKGTDINVAYFGYSQAAEPKDTTTPVEIVAANPEVGIVFTEVNETVTAKSETNLRTVPSSADDSTIAVKLKNGETATRTGIGNNGWARVLYNGQKLYAVSSYLTTDLSYSAASAQTSTGSSESSSGSGVDADGYTPVNDTVTPKNDVNLRSSADMSSGDNIIGLVSYGEVLTRTGTSTGGWSRLLYNGQTVYAVTQYLTTDMNYKAANTPTTENPEAGMSFTAVNDTVTPKIQTNLRTVPNTESADTVVATVSSGEALQRTGTSSKGWSRISYNGQTVYAVTSYLTAVQ